MRISDWSSYVCASDLPRAQGRIAHGRAPLFFESAQQRLQWRSGRALGTALILLLVPALPLQAQQAPGNTSDGTGGEASAGEPLAGEVESGRYVFQAAGCLQIGRAAGRGRGWQAG